jgi:hypothetical protein
MNTSRNELSLSQAAAFDRTKGHRDMVLAHCPPSADCKVCDGRLTHRLGKKADKTAKWRHQAGQNGQMARTAASTGNNLEVVYALARRAGTYGNLALVGGVA